MATQIITDKQERLAYIKQAAQQVRAEKARVKELYEIEAEIETEFKQDDDYLSIENIDGLTVAGVQKVCGGIRRLPVIIY
jgi:hypothetical protein